MAATTSGRFEEGQKSEQTANETAVKKLVRMVKEKGDSTMWDVGS